MQGGGGYVSAKSSKQKVVTRSSTESEIIALEVCTVHILWHRTKELGYQQAPIVIYQDNKSTIHIA